MSHTNGIGSSPLLTTLLGQTDRINGAATGRSTATKGASVAGADSAQLSSTGSVLAQAATSVSDVRTEKVASIKAAIDAGTYNVPAGAVADKLIESLIK